MQNIKINTNVHIYFTTSWIVGMLMIAFEKFQFWEPFACLLGFTFLNMLINVLVIVFLLVMLFTFPENRPEFIHSVILLLFNFPFILTIYLLSL